MNATGKGKTAARAWRYPPREEHPDQPIFIYEDWCKSCGICSEVCPAGVLGVDDTGRPHVENADACIACYLCEQLCPDMAITVYKERKKGSGAAKDSEGGGERG